MPQDIVIIGAVALGPKAACRFKRLEPESRVIMVDQDDRISYGGCGIPYFISGDISEPDQLQSTSFNMVRDEKFFRNAKDIDVMINTRALSIDRGKKIVMVQNVLNGTKQSLSYDKLVLATGSRPIHLPIPGCHLDGVFTISGLNKAIAIKNEVAAGNIGKAVIIGAGPIGLELAESLADLWGIETAVVEIKDQILPGIMGRNMARMAQQHMQENDVSFYIREEVTRFEGRSRVERVVTNRRKLYADLVIVAVGVAPNSDLASEAGLEVSKTGAIVVNKKMQTSDPSIYAGGDCVEIPNLITGRQGYWPLGSLANRQGRVIGTNLAGGHDEFEGAVGSFSIKLFDISLASAGLSLESAKNEGYDALNGFVVQFDRAHFYPEKELLYLELVAQRDTGRVLGIQGMGGKGTSAIGRVATVAAILKYKPKTSDISNMEFPYSPPFSAAMDVLNALGNTTQNILEGKNRVIEADEFSEWWNDREADNTFFLDCRNWGNAGPFTRKYPDHWKSIPQDELQVRLGEVPRDKKIVLICNTGVRSYEAQVTLDQMGIKDSYNLQGGVAALKKWGLDL